jgi:hypothetical protein
MKRLSYRIPTSVDQIAPRIPSVPFPPLTGGKGTPPPSLSRRGDGQGVARYSCRRATAGAMAAARRAGR